MNSKLIKAVELLKEGDYTCVWVKDNNFTSSRERGVKPLLKRIDGGGSLNGYYAADKVVGNGAAMLYVLLEVSELYALVISESALATLKNHNIPVYYDLCVTNIRNRTNTGICPMEEAVEGISSPEKALEAIRNKLKTLNK